MYSTKTATSNNTEFVSSYMPAGINENVTLKSVEAKKSPTGKDFIEFVFQNSEGKTVPMTEWKNEKGMFDKTDEDLQRRDDLQFGRIMQIINCFLPTVEAEFSNFKEMIDWVCDTLNPMIALNSKLRLKVVYDKKNYTTVSKNGIFVEKMDVETSEIKKLGRDKFERQVIADTEKSVDPLTSNGTPEEGADDLPF